MSNRVLGFLIILIFILSGIAFFMYAFLYNHSKFIINSNVDNYSVELYNKKTLKKYNFDCKNKKCFLENIPPFTYKLTITKKGYNQIILKKSLPRNETINIDIKLEKKVILEEVINNLSKEDFNHLNNKKVNNNDFETNLEGQKKLTAKERIKALIAKKNKIKNSLNKIENNIKLKNTKNKKYKFLTKIDLFKNTDFSKITVLEISGNKNIFFIKNKDKKYIYNKITANLDEINLKIPVIYLKKNSNYKINLVTKNGIFKYSLKSKKLKYFPLFQDYINYKGNYIGLISSEDKTRKTNFGFENEKENLIIFYNRKDFSKKIIYKTNKNIKKILLENNNIFIVNANNKKFKLSNFD